MKLRSAERNAVIGLFVMTLLIAVFVAKDLPSAAWSIAFTCSATFLTLDYLRWENRKYRSPKPRVLDARGHLRLIHGGLYTEPAHETKDKSA